KIKTAPVRVPRHPLRFLAGPSGIVLDVGLECGALLQDLYQFGADIAGRGFDLVEPRKRLPVVELDLRELGKEIRGGLLEIDLLLAEEDVDRLQETRGGLRASWGFAGQPLLEEGFEFALVARAHVCGADQIAAEVGRQLVGRGRGLEREPIERSSSPPIALFREMVRFED